MPAILLRHAVEDQYVSVSGLPHAKTGAGFDGDLRSAEQEEGIPPRQRRLADGGGAHVRSGDGERLVAWPPFVDRHARASSLMANPVENKPQPKI